MLERKRSLLRCLVTNLSQKLDVSAGGYRFSDPSPKRKKSVRSFARYIVARDQICERFPYCALHLLAIHDTMRSWPELLKYFSLCSHFELSVIWNSHPAWKWLPAISLLKLCESSLAKSTFGVDFVLFIIIRRRTKSAEGCPNPLADIYIYIYIYIYFFFWGGGVGGGGGGPNPFRRHWVELAQEWKQGWCVTIRHK